MLDDGKIRITCHLLLVMLHELMHKKRLIKMMDFKYLIKTEKKFQNEIGEYFEKKVFKTKIADILDNLDTAHSKLIMTVDTWKNKKTFSFLGKIKKSKQNLLSSKTLETSNQGNGLTCQRKLMNYRSFTSLLDEKF
jgi:6-pyruvoyl-tetrahydropterin synthase